MDRTKIEWCDSTWNPVTGCYHNCQYCYARRIATRFGGNDKHSTFRPYQSSWRRADENKGLFYDEVSAEKPMLFEIDKRLFLPNKLDKQATEKHGRQIFRNKKAPYPFDFNPTLHRYKLDEPQHWKKPRTIFVCSMANLFGDWVPDSWIEEVFTACSKAPQHRYLFLTKNPKRYWKLANEGKLPKGNNMWYGTTITETVVERDFYKTLFYQGAYHSFVSIEPICRDYSEEELDIICNYTQWVIVGAETGNRKGKIIPQASLIERITEKSIRMSIALFMKDSLLSIVGEENMFRILPWDDDYNSRIKQEQAWLDKYYEEENKR
ncbi:MAG: phage Gp37/Gp68 family protein [Ruminococcus sp.]|nr:phage Gp37/Gp68 family protein [Ruminococcus sp.]